MIRGRINRMGRKSLPALHPAGILIGAIFTGIGVFVAETFVGPVLSKSLAPAEERMLGMVHQRLSESYVEPRDPEWLMHRAIEGMTTSLEDPYTYFIGPEQMVELDEDSSGKLIGIGVIIDSVSGNIRYPILDGPAAEAGIRPGDRFLSIDGEDVRGQSVEELIKRIKGPRSSQVKFELERADGGLFSTTVTRRAVPRGTVAKTELLDQGLGIGYLHLRSFARSTPNELDLALDQLTGNGQSDYGTGTGLKGLILDLRFNTGGLLDSAIDVAARFLDGGVVCRLQVRGAEDVVRYADTALSKATDIPLVVLTNGLSASGSEVLAGALRDHGAAILFGSRTFGKGVYQQVHRYRSGNFALKFTAGYYLTPSGRILEGHIDPDRAGGLLPDVPLQTSHENSREVRNWLSYDLPPVIWREDVFRLFPEVAEFTAPDDQVRKMALDHLREVLSS